MPKYKFKNWNKTNNGKTKVTDKIKENRAKKIAEILGNAEKWHSHGRGITMEELKGLEIKLSIEDYGKNSELSTLIRNYHGLCVDFARKHGIIGFIHNKTELRKVI